MLDTGTYFVRGRMKLIVIDFIPICHHICKLRVNWKFLNYSYLRSHGPTELSLEERKDSIYNELNKVFDKCLRSNIKIILGDFNAKIEKEDILRPTIGKSRFQNRTSENGKSLINFFQEFGIRKYILPWEGYQQRHIEFTK